MPHTQNPPVSTLHVRTRGSVPTYNPRNFAWRHAIWCNVVIVPTSPITVGQKVRLVEVHGPSESPGDEDEETPHEAKDIDVEGVVTNVRTLETDLVEFVVKNEIEGAMTELAYISVENAPGRTVTLTGWTWLISKTMLPLIGKTTRRVPTLASTGRGDVLGNSEDE
ncbi:hypothetical protein C2E23DRAFT_742632 [Lenzites betulinus]|nr:hypothetical protein C2E23DRAFT_742632 [Lenzites betulinus]